MTLVSTTPTLVVVFMVVSSHKDSFEKQVCGAVVGVTQCG